MPINFIEFLKTSHVFEEFKGFQSNPFPLYKLGNLLNEIWLEEDILNGLCELRYLRQHVLAHRLDCPPCFLYLPTNFFTAAQALFYSTPRIYDRELLDLQKRVADTNVNTIAFTTCQENHYAAYLYRQNQPYIEYGDSLHHPPPRDALDILRWVFTGLGQDFPSQVISGTISLQGSGNGGDGSCAIAALNFVESRLDSTVSRWSGSASEAYRNKCLRDLLIYHHVSSSSQPSVSNCMVRCISPTETSIDSAFAYTNFNIFSPTVCS